MTRLLLPLLLLALPQIAHADDWPQWLGPKRDGVLREQGLVETFPEKGLKRVWANLIGPGYTGPAIADGRLFVMDRELKDTPTPTNGFQKGEVGGKERILCYNADTGKELWKHSYDCVYKVQYGSGPRCTPTVDEALVYCLGTMGDLICLESATGKVVWSKNFVNDYQARVSIWGFASHPLVDGDNLICLVGGKEGKLVIAFDKKTGKENWTSQSLDESDSGYCPPMIYTFAGVRTLVIWHSRACVGLNPETGKRLWSQPFDVKAGLTTPTPRQLGDKLLITAFYEGPMMLDLSKPGAVSVAWKGNGKGETPEKTDKLHSIIATPFIKDGYIYGVCSYGELRCLKADTGERVWETRKATVGTATKEGPATRWGTAFLIEYGDRFFLFNEQGWLITAKLTPKGYEEISRTYVITPSNKMAGRPVVWSHPAFANKKMYVRNDVELVCVDLAK